VLQELFRFRFLHEVSLLRALYGFHFSSYQDGDPLSARDPLTESSFAPAAPPISFLVRVSIFSPPPPARRVAHPPQGLFGRGSAFFFLGGGFFCFFLKASLSFSGVVCV